MWSDDRLDERFRAIDQRFDQLERKVDDGFARMDTGFAEIRGEFSALKTVLLQVAFGMVGALIAACVALIIGLN